ncbi:MAG: tRNA lysidine(34) synthetase TilS [Bacilli bacterium]|nr:tRNA lysidine(34) synthetase TilS [Bacilli bacterium]
MQNANSKLFELNDRIVVAVSGGIDSMVLLHWLTSLVSELNLKITVCHVNHNRRESSLAEVKFVKTSAQAYGFDFALLDYNYEGEGNFHHEARIARYDFFYETAKRYQATKIVLAHQADDLVETILMRIVRGSSLTGYAGIRETAPFRDLKIVRPLLEVSRETIENYQKTHNIKYVEDESNKSDEYTRNRFRHDIVPLLKRENEKYIDKFIQFANYIDESHELVSDLANQFILNSVEYSDSQFSFSASKLRAVHKIVRYEIYKLLIDKLANNTVEISYVQFNDLDLLINSESSKLELDIDQYITVFKSYDFVTIMKERPLKTDYEYVLSDFKEIGLPGEHHLLISKNNSNLSGKVYELWYNDLDLIFPLTIRNRRPGDRVLMPGGTRKLKSVMIDNKVPHIERDELPLVFDKFNNLLWIPSIFKQKTNGSSCLYLAYWKG